jgi:hypothetical protein
MTRTLTIILMSLLLALPAGSSPKILKTYQWNGKQYSRVQLDDGSTVEIKGAVGETPAATLAKVAAPATKTEEVQATAGPLLAQATTEQLAAEIAKRKLTAEQLGLVTKEAVK